MRAKCWTDKAYYIAIVIIIAAISHNPVWSQEPNSPIMLHITTGREVPGSSFITEIPSGGFNRLLIYKGMLFASSFREGQVSFFDTKGMALTNRVEMEEYKRDIIYDSNGTNPVIPRQKIISCSAGDLAIAGGKLFVAQVFSEFVLVIDISTGKIIYKMPVGGEGVFTSSPRGNILYFASNLRNVFNIIDPFTYKFETIPFPDGGRGIGSIGISPDGRFLYLGIRRGGVTANNEESGGSYLAVYDLAERRYIVTIYLGRIGSDDTNKEDVSSPGYILPADDGRVLYIGMFQSQAGIQIVDVKKLEITGNIAFTPNKRNEYFKWVDPLSLAFYRDYLISFNRNNAELAIIDRKLNYVLATLNLGMELTSGASIVIDGESAYVAHPERKAILVIDMKKLASFIFSRE